MEDIPKRLRYRPSFVSLLSCALIVSIYIRSRWAADQFAVSLPSFIVGLSYDSEAVCFYYGERYMLNRDGHGFVHRSDYPTVRPMDRMGLDSYQMYFATPVWGSWYTVAALSTGEYRRSR